MRPDLMSMETPTVVGCRLSVLGAYRRPRTDNRELPLLPARQNVVQHHPIDLPIHPHPHVVVLPVHEVGERLEECLVRGALRRGKPLLGLAHRLVQEDRLELPHHVRRDRQQVLGSALEEIQLVQCVEPLQLADGVGVVVDADVDVAVVATQVASVVGLPTSSTASTATSAGGRPLFSGK